MSGTGRVRRMAAIAGVAALLVAGCSGDDATPASSPVAQPTSSGQGGPEAQPVVTTEADWQAVAEALGRPGKLSADGLVYRVGFPRRDLSVRSHDVQIAPGLALGSYAAFSRYPDGTVVMMGDLVVTEAELPPVTDTLQEGGVEQTAVHKHLLAHEPELWWSHIHGAAPDPVAMAQTVRMALNRTSTPPPADAGPSSQPQLELDTAALDAALGTTGTNDGGIYKFSFQRNEPITGAHGVLAPGMGITTAINFQPTGGGRAAINGDFAMLAEEVQPVIQALRAGGIEIVEVHNHSLDDQPRVFYLHFWANDDAAELAQALGSAVRAHNVSPAS
jgi:hypothetical protein